MSVYFIFNYAWGVIDRIGQVIIFKSFFLQLRVLFRMYVRLQFSECCGCVFLNLG